MNNDSNKEPPVLVCARADSPRMCEGSIFGKHCSKCGVEVMIAPSGQDILKLHPELRIMCGDCFGLVNEPMDCRLAAPASQIIREAKTAQPNPRRKAGRN